MVMVVRPDLRAIIKGLKSKVDPFIKEAVTLEALGNKMSKG
jgi:hypothetical protein